MVCPAIGHYTCIISSFRNRTSFVVTIWRVCIPCSIIRMDMSITYQSMNNDYRSRRLLIIDGIF
jgi:hypothetical protein